MDVTAALDQLTEAISDSVKEQIIAFLTERGFTQAAIAVADGYTYTSQD